jgi:hypothetical protein
MESIGKATVAQKQSNLVSIEQVVSKQVQVLLMQVSVLRQHLQPIRELMTFFK